MQVDLFLIGIACGMAFCLGLVFLTLPNVDPNIPEAIVLNPATWECTASVMHYHPAIKSTPYRVGNNVYGDKGEPEYTEKLCYQWSIKGLMAR
jgi:hypothetical protein